jgi:hypothetical protein
MDAYPHNWLDTGANDAHRVVLSDERSRVECRTRCWRSRYGSRFRTKKSCKAPEQAVWEVRVFQASRNPIYSARFKAELMAFRSRGRKVAEQRRTP